MKKISAEVVRKIALAISAWEKPRPPSWRDVGEIAERVCGRVVSRQWLCTTRDIKDAYEQTHKTYSALEDGGRRSPRSKSAKATIATLKLKLEFQERILHEYDELLTRLQLAAVKEAVPLAALAKPLRPLRS